MLEQQIDQDLKQARLGGDKPRVEVLRGLKSVLLYEKVAKGLRDSGLSDEAVLTLISKEVKKRTESAELYEKADAQDRAEAEIRRQKERRNVLHLAALKCVAASISRKAVPRRNSHGLDSRP